MTVQNSLPDNQLLNQVSEDDELAFRVLFERYKNKVYNFAFKFTKSVVQSEEIVQEVFLKLWLRRKDPGEIENLEGWLYMVARNLSFNALKKIAYDYTYRKSLAADPESASLQDQVVFKDYQQMLNKIVQDLPARQKEIYQLRRNEGLKINEIATQLGISPNTVKVHLSKSLQQIREALNGKIEPIIIFILTSFLLD